MSAYIEPIKVAVFIFPFLALLISLPFFIFEYRKFGRFTISSGLILYSFVFYLLCAYFLVILPLPAREVVAQLTTPKYELMPGNSLMTFLNQTVLNISDPSTYIPAMKQGVFLEPVFNVLLLFPFGLYLRYYFKLSLKKTILFSFCFSLFFELTQLSGLYFIYPRPYRLFDVNDLIHNTLGGTLGYLMAPLFTFMLPTREQLDESAYEKGQQVTLIRRLVAFAIDWVVISVLEFFITPLLEVVTGWNLGSETVIGYTLIVLLYFVLFNYLLNGQTIGKKVVKIRIVQQGRMHVGLGALLLRYSLFYLLLNYLSRIANALSGLIIEESELLQAVSIILFAASLLLLLLFLLNLLLAFVLRKRVLFYEKASKTYTISTIKKNA